MTSEVRILPQALFESVVKSTPLVSIDFVVRASNFKILLGLRNNRPAQGFWFVPGGRVLKGESFDTAFYRLLYVELGLRSKDVTATFMGLYQHFYPDNFSGEDFGTHYIVLAYAIQLKEALLTLPNQQHSDYRWFKEHEIFESTLVHKHTKWYFESGRCADSKL